MLSAAHLTRHFGTRVAVHDVSLDLEGGQVLALLGPNGAGKTTTLRMLAGLIAPTRGTLTLAGTPYERRTMKAIRSQIGLLTESPGLWDRLSVQANLLVYARLHGLEAPDRAVARALNAFSIADRARQPAVELSKGLKQRVALARALLHDPKVVLLDEPTAGLDPESAREVRDLVLRLKREGRVVLVSTHNLDEVDRVADRVAVLRTRLVALDTPGRLRAKLFGAALRIELTQPAATFVSHVARSGVGQVVAEGQILRVDVSDPAVSTPLVVKALVDAGAVVLSVTREEPTLEAVYLKLLEDEAS
jgi:ABC-2 type transport system ATP-binding protein